VSFDDVHVENLGCHGQWAHYCASVKNAVQFAIDHRKKVLVVTQPYLNDLHREQQRELRTMLASRFGANPDVGYVDLGSAITSYAKFAYDGMHLTAEGNDVIARELVAPVARLMPEAFNPPAPVKAAGQ